MTTTESPTEPRPRTGRYPGPRRGRHRRYRPRKTLLAAGGFALAAGVLGLTQLMSGSALPGNVPVLGAAPHAGPDGGGARTDGDADDRAGVAARWPTPGGADGTGGSTGRAPARGGPADSAMGGLNSSSGVPLIPGGPGGPGDRDGSARAGGSGAGPLPDPPVTTIPEAPDAPAESPGPRPPRAPEPAPPEAPPRTPAPPPTRTPAPGPGTPPAPSPEPAPPPPPEPAPSPSPAPTRPGLCLPIIRLCLDLRAG
ncbi:hypothetical protein [Streptomyces sp. SID8352]|uniref:hypothetical protein n=1 Tax=Streptomyces sp. SID8352 TaxID=2690338 RepID=UPI00136CB713|nr:hypothetical protein [Streptomyces sp. SID8352]MYU25717.1 hypothetical protein [Streptomyces sp. SID8352]